MKHVAIIMDGNGRWAKARGLPRVFGHREGAKRVREIVTAAGELGIKQLTLFAFSEENWKRPRAEVSILMKLLEFHLVSERDRLNENGVKLRVIGAIEKLPERVQKSIHDTCEFLSKNSRVELTLAISYSGQSELVRVCQEMALQSQQMGARPESITAESIDTFLAEKSVGPVDLLIRTSGEYRISNFLLWQLAYAELYFTQIPWPDFTKSELEKAVETFYGRDRRFGEIKTELHSIGDLGIDDSVFLNESENSCTQATVSETLTHSNEILDRNNSKRSLQNQVSSFSSGVR